MVVIQAGLLDGNNEVEAPFHEIRNFSMRSSFVPSSGQRRKQPQCTARELIRRQVRRMVDSDPQIEVCAEAENGAEAVSKTRKYRPDLVVIDIFMPEVNGLDAVREIKKRVPGTPVVMFTLYDSDTIRGESEKAGADVVLLKDKGGVELLPTIHNLLNTDPIPA